MLRRLIITICVGLGLAPSPLAAPLAVDEATAVSGAWPTAEGLPDNSLTRVAQTADGFLWGGRLAV